MVPFLTKTSAGAFPALHFPNCRSWAELGEDSNYSGEIDTNDARQAIPCLRYSILFVILFRSFITYDDRSSIPLWQKYSGKQLCKSCNPIYQRPFGGRTSMMDDCRRPGLAASPDVTINSFCRLPSLHLASRGDDDEWWSGRLRDKSRKSRKEQKCNSSRLHCNTGIHCNTCIPVQHWSRAEKPSWRLPYVCILFARISYTFAPWINKIKKRVSPLKKGFSARLKNEAKWLVLRRGCSSQIHLHRAKLASVS